MPSILTKNEWKITFFYQNWSKPLKKKIICTNFLFLDNLMVNSHGIFTRVSGLCHPGISFVVLNRGHHFLLKKARIWYLRQLEHNNSNSITLLYSLSIFQQSKPGGTDYPDHITKGTLVFSDLPTALIKLTKQLRK